MSLTDDEIRRLANLAAHIPGKMILPGPSVLALCDAALRARQTAAALEQELAS